LEIFAAFDEGNAATVATLLKGGDGAVRNGRL